MNINGMPNKPMSIAGINKCPTNIGGIKKMPIKKDEFENIKMEHELGKQIMNKQGENMLRRNISNGGNNNGC